MSCISHKKTAKFSQKRVGQAPGCILRLYGDSPTTLPHDARYTDIVCAAISRIEWLPVCSQHIPYVVRHTSSFIRTDTTFWNLATRKQLVPGPLTAPHFLQQRRLAHDEKRRRRRKSCDQCPFLVHTKPNALFGVLTVVLHSRPFCMVCVASCLPHWLSHPSPSTSRNSPATCLACGKGSAISSALQGWRVEMDRLANHGRQSQD